MRSYHLSNKGYILLGIVVFLALSMSNVRASINVTGCQSLNISNEIYVLQNDLYTNSSCWLFDADNITFDCNWYKVMVDPKKTWFTSNKNQTIQNCMIEVNASNWTDAIISFEAIGIADTVTLKNINLTLNGSVDCGGSCVYPINLYYYKEYYLENITINDYTQAVGTAYRSNYLFALGSYIPGSSVTANGLYVYANTDLNYGSKTFYNFGATDNFNATNLYAEVNITSWVGTNTVTAFLIHNHPETVGISNIEAYFDNCYRDSNLLNIGNFSDVYIDNMIFYGTQNDCGRNIIGWLADTSFNATISNFICSGVYRCLMATGIGGSLGEYVIDNIKSNLTTSADIASFHNATIIKNCILNSSRPIYSINVPPINLHPEGSLFYNNYFLNGSGIDISNQNYWNTTKQLETNIIGGSYIGGNFYDDYTGCDNNSDGIGETFYQIDVNNIDYLPLTNNVCPENVTNYTIDITIYSPENITYNTSLVDLDVSANGTVNQWYYDINGTNISFSPNITMDLSNDFYELIVWGRNGTNWFNEIQFFTVNEEIIILSNLTELCTPEIITMCEPFGEWTSAICIDNSTLRKIKGCSIYWSENSTDYVCNWEKIEDVYCDNGCYNNITRIGSGCAPTDIEILGITGVIFVIFVIIISFLLGGKRRKR